jgi:hypothetical protein
MRTCRRAIRRWPSLRGRPSVRCERAVAVGRPRAGQRVSFLGGERFAVRPTGGSSSFGSGVLNYMLVNDTAAVNGGDGEVIISHTVAAVAITTTTTTSVPRRARSPHRMARPLLLASMCTRCSRRVVGSFVWFSPTRGELSAAQENPLHCLIASSVVTQRPWTRHPEAAVCSSAFNRVMDGCVGASRCPPR